jgi:FkbM family methyltransferase
MTALRHASSVRRITQALRLSGVARQIAYRAATRGQRQITLTRAGTTVTFCVPTAEIWRVTDTVAAEHVLSRWLELVQPGDVVYDIGAHLGVYSTFAAARRARVFAFEPDTAQHDVFRMNCRANHLDAAITLAPVALSDCDGMTLLFPGDGVAALDGVATSQQRGSTPLEVPLVRADAWVKSHACPAPTVIKMDVEGYESAVLDGFGDLLSSVRVAFCEIHPDQLLPGETPESILARLSRNGLRVSDNSKYEDRYHVLALRS